jgi:two-component system chemotaxis response regulator CheY
MTEHVTNAASASTLLLVDDDARYLDTVAPLFEAWSAGRWKILRAPSVARALSLLKEQPVDALVADYQMPVADGLQLIQLTERSFPGLPKAVLTGSTDSQVRAACIAAGADLVLAKPSDPALLRDVFAHLSELLAMCPQQGFRGVVRQADLSEIIQIECLGAKSSCLEIRAGAQRGRIFIREGRIIHAEMGAARGEDAFNRIVALRGGDFSIAAFRDPDAETISGSWEMLLMEAARVRDELAGAPAPPEETIAPAPQETAVVANAPAPRVEPEPCELLVVDDAHAVLHVRGVRDQKACAAFLDWAAQAAARLQRLTPLGSPEGAAFAGPDVRVSLRFAPGWSAWAVVKPASGGGQPTDDLPASDVLALATARSARDIVMTRPAPEFSLSILGELVRFSDDAHVRLERLGVRARTQCWRFRSGLAAVAHHEDGTARLAILAATAGPSAVQRWLDAAIASEPNYG